VHNSAIHTKKSDLILGVTALFVIGGLFLKGTVTLYAHTLADGGKKTENVMQLEQKK
jgi:hypothetical protein